MTINPGDVSAWSSKAWSAFYRAEDEQTWQALDRAWTLAPVSLALAEDRLRLVAGLSETMPDDFTANDLQDDVLRDALILNESDPDVWAELASTIPLLIAIDEALALSPSTP